MSANDAEPGRVGRVIITYSRSWHALAAIRSLGRHGVEVVAGDEYALTPGSLSRYTIDNFVYPGPAEDPDQFLSALEAAVHEHAPAEGVPYVLMPMHQESHLIAMARERFEPCIVVPLAPAEQFELVSHKGRLTQHAQSRGFTVPETWSPETAEDLERIVAEVRFPAFVKRPAAAAGVGIRRVTSAEEIRREFLAIVEVTGWSEDKRPIIQATVPGDDFCVTALFNRGELKASMTYRNVRTFPRDHGPGVVRETVSAPKLERLTSELLGGIGWHGIAQVDFRWSGDEEDPAYLLEVNPRFFGGLFQSIESGVDYPWLLFQMATNGDVSSPDSVQIGVRTEAPIAGFLAHISEFVEREPDLSRLGSAWREALLEIERGRAWSGVRALLAGLSESVDVEGRVERVRRVLEENEQNVSMLFAADDPLAVLGIVYPLAVFLKHGKLTADVISSVDTGV